jgi:2-polyprenyl-3-methyl-5-hydroxy-6-metoxy-1,4-benzoquinol methylase
MTKTSLPTNFVKHTSKNPLQKFLINNFFSSLISLLKPLNAKSILDAGCGEGFTMDKLLKEKVTSNIEGVEYSKEAIALGKKLYPSLTIRQGSVYNLPYKDRSFDLVICTEVLEHLKDPTKALKEMLRVTKKYLIISTPNEPFFMLGNFLRGKNLSRLGNDPGHINHWSCLGLKIYLEKNGLTIKKIKLPFPWTIVLGTK